MLGEERLQTETGSEQLGTPRFVEVRQQLQVAVGLVVLDDVQVVRAVEGRPEDARCADSGRQEQRRYEPVRACVLRVQVSRHARVRERDEVAPGPGHVVVLGRAQFENGQVVERGRCQRHGHRYGNEDGRQDDLREEAAPVAHDVVEALDDDGAEVVQQKELGAQHVAAPAFEQDPRRS